MSTKVIIRAEPALRVAQFLAELSFLALCIGVLGEAGAATHPGTDLPVATIALYAEFGTIDAPARSFLRSTMFERRQDIADLWAREVAAGIRAAVAGTVDAVGCLSRIGAAIVVMLRVKLDSSPSWAAANAPSTVAKKGHAVPLLGGAPAKGITGGTLRDSLGWSVRRLGAVVAEAA